MMTMYGSWKIEWIEVEILPFDNYQKDKYMGIYG